MRWPGGPRRWLIGATAGLVALTALVVWAVWPQPREPLARQYRDVTACLLTGADGVNGRQAAPVWAGMQEASGATLGKVQYLEVDGPQTAENAKTFLASLVRGRCDLVLTVDDAPNAALQATAATYPKNRFVMVGAGKGGANVSVVDASEPNSVRDAVRAAVSSVLKGTPGP